MTNRYVHLLILLGATLLVWGTSLWNGFVWDDRILILKNEERISHLSIAQAFLRDFWSTETEDGRSNYYRPLVTLSYMVDYAVYGLNPVGYHATNVLIHVVGVASLWYLLVLLGVASGGAALAAALWAIHPVVAESVAWVSGRTDSLATAFSLLAVIAGMKGVGAERSGRQWILLYAGLFAAGLLCKESALVTPLFTLIFCAFRGERAERNGAFVWSSLGVLLGWIILRAFVLSNTIGVESGEGMPFLLALLSLAHTWGALVWPPVFRIEYGSSLTPHTLIGGAVLGGFVMAWMAFVSTRQREPRVVSFLFLAAFLAFVPSVMAVFLRSMIGARLVYTASAFALAGLAIGLRLEERSVRGKQVFGCVLVALAVFSWQRAHLWRSDVVLFSAALEDADASTRNHLNLGIALFDAGDLTGALDHLSHDMDRSALNQRFYMLGLLYTAVQCESLAEEHLTKSIEANPAYYSAYHNLAGLQVMQGRREEGLRTLETIAERDPSVRARALAQREAIQKLPVMTLRRPHNAEWCGTERGLRELFTTALTLNRLAGEQLRTGQWELAEVLVRAALRVDPWFVGARLNLAQLQLVKGDKREAQVILRSILNTDPGEARAQRMLSMIDGGSVSGYAR